MSTPTIRRLTGILLVLIPLAFTALFTLLQVQFEYPDILRQPTPDVLTKFQAGGAGLIAAWYALTLTAVLFIPVVVMLHHLMAGDRAPATLWVATTFGVIAGLTQALGFLRWPFLVPHLAQAYLDPAASDAQRAAAAMVFEAFHRYAGMAVGEHLGYLSTSSWSLLIAALMLRQGGIWRWLGGIGIALALGVATGLLEPAGVPLVGAINAISYLGWALWLVAVGVVLLIQRGDATIATPSLASAR